MKVSVIIPAYNRPDFVREAVDSVLAQKFRDFEVIVIDDGSPRDIAGGLQSCMDRIHFVRQQNGGVNQARNHAMQLARGEYIATLDDDDIWLPDKLGIQVEILDYFPRLAMTWSNFGIYYSAQDIRDNGMQTWYAKPMNWSSFFDETLTPETLPTALAEKLPATARLHIGDIYHPSLHQYYVLPSTALFRRSMVPAGVQFIEHDPICGDWDFFARLSRDAPVAYLDADLALNRSHRGEDRLTAMAWVRQMAYRVDMIERLYRQDRQFYQRYQAEVDTVLMKRLGQLCRQQILAGEVSQTGETLQKFRQLSGASDPQYLLHALACRAPGVAAALRGIRQLQEKIR